MKLATPTLLVLIFLGALPSCRQGSARTAAGKDLADPSAKPTGAHAMDQEGVPALVARLQGDDDPKAPQARDQLLKRWPKLSATERTAAADAILEWTSRHLPRQPEAGGRLLPQVITLIAPAASEAALSGFARAHAACLVAENPPDPAPVMAQLETEPYGPHLRRELLSAALQAFDVTLPLARQQRVLALITGCAQGPDRKVAGDVILKNLQVKEKISLESVRALGELQAEGATEYLRLFVQMDVPVALRRVAIEAIAALRDDPTATEVLYDLAKPVFFSILSGDALEAKLLERSRWAMTGLGKTRACSLAAKEYASLRKIYRQKPAATVAALRAEALPSLIRLMWCADPKKTRADVPSGDRKLAGLPENQ